MHSFAILFFGAFFGAMIMVICIMATEVDPEMVEQNVENRKR